MKNNENIEKTKVNFEEFFERNNSKIQIAICIISLLIGVYLDILQKNGLGIIIALLSLISAELLSMSIKDSITQRKLNNIGIKFEILRGALVRVHDFDLTDFFEETRGHFFISGMALNGFFENNKSTIGKFLNEGKTVYVLIASPESVKQNALLYHGISHDETELMKNMNDLLNKQVDTLNCIEKIPGIFDYIENGRFRLRTLDTVFSTSFVAYDIFEREILGNGKKKGKELKASFYQYRCIEPKNEPNIVVDSFSSRDWYLFFKDTIKLQWDDGHVIATAEEFEELRDTMNNMLQVNRDMQKGKK